LAANGKVAAWQRSSGDDMMRIRGCGATLVGLILVLVGRNVGVAAIIELNSISDIPSGTTISFSEPGSPNLGIVVSQFDMSAWGPDGIWETAEWLNGNSDAPIGGDVLGFDGTTAITIATTGDPWSAIGFSGTSSTVGLSTDFTLGAFDSGGGLIGTTTGSFNPADSSHYAFNRAAVFVGVSSSTPIHSIAITSTQGWSMVDSLRFTSIPEPSILTLIATGVPAWIWATRRRRSGRCSSRRLAASQTA